MSERPLSHDIVDFLVFHRSRSLSPLATHGLSGPLFAHDLQHKQTRMQHQVKQTTLPIPQSRSTGWICCTFVCLESSLQ